MSDVQKHLGRMMAAKRWGRDPEPHRQNYLEAKLSRAVDEALGQGLAEERLGRILSRRETP